jgi:ligand-binding SRPBCC domain-containing protein
MPVYKIIREQHVNASLEEVWAFFTHAKNLLRITPPDMSFKVTSENLPDEIYPGMIITYRLKPLLGIPVSWATEITHVVPMKYFVDEQRHGPYRMWHHEHHFSEAADGGVLMRDVVHYQLPLGILGRLAHWLLVNKQLTNIFDYRKHQIEALFPRA